KFVFKNIILKFSPNNSFQVIGKLEFSNLKCISWDPEWVDFEYCYLKAFNRSFKYLSLKTKLYKLPVTELKITSKVEFTNIKCTSLDMEFDDFEYCRIKSVNRTYKYISLKVKLYKIPVNNVKVNYALLKRFSGYKPFLYNITVDACKVLKHPKSNPIFGFFHSLFSSYSNMNHTCPYNHDLIIDRLSISFMNHHLTQVLPFPLGDYLFQSNWISHGINRANVNVYFTLS
ncbi:hypothetical protein KR032_008077, partial [Drosophila birchii]